MPNQGKTIGTALAVIPTESLNRAIASELNIPDPDINKAKAALDEGNSHEDIDRDNSNG